MGNLLAIENDLENGGGNGDNGNGANGGNGTGDGAEWLQTAGRFIWKGKLEGMD
jgi:hypothetical protein